MAKRFSYLQSILSCLDLIKIQFKRNRMIFFHIIVSTELLVPFPFSNKYFEGPFNASLSLRTPGTTSQTVITNCEFNSVTLMHLQSLHFRLIRRQILYCQVVNSLLSLYNRSLQLKY